MPVVEIGLAFLEGLALIFSPCILPVLPLVLASSLDGGRARPYGIIAGFVLAFTAFALASRTLLASLAIDPEVVRTTSLVLLAGFGLVLLSEKLSGIFSNATQRFANVGQGGGAQGGFFSGLLIGFLIGLVWTPCAGPILAAVLVQIIRQQEDTAGLMIIAAFSFGAAVPMLLIALSGRRFMRQIGALSAHAHSIRRGFGVIILLAVALLWSGAIPTGEVKPTITASAGSSTGLIDALPEPYKAPELAGITAWLNSNPQTLASLKGKVVLIDFWTYSCINCVRTLPYITQWDEKYRDKGLVIIGVHAPEFEFEKNQQNVEAAIAAHNIKYPVAMDNAFDTWTAFSNKYWPAHYLIDQEGNVVYRHFGEGSYDVTEHNIRALLGITGSTATQEPTRAPDAQTSETYVGYERAKTMANEKGLKDAPRNYTMPELLKDGEFGLGGDWIIEGERIVAASAGASLKLNFTARKVFLVLGSPAPNVAHITLNGVAQPDIAVTQNTLYQLVEQPELAQGLIEITADAPGLEAYAFTFGS